MLNTPGEANSLGNIRRLEEPAEVWNFYQDLMFGTVSVTLMAGSDSVIWRAIWRRQGELRGKRVELFQFFGREQYGD